MEVRRLGVAPHPVGAAVGDGDAGIEHLDRAAGHATHRLRRASGVFERAQNGIFREFEMRFIAAGHRHEGAGVSDCRFVLLQ